MTPQEEILKFVAEGQLEKALSKLKEYQNLNPQIKEEIVTLSSRYSRWKKAHYIEGREDDFEIRKITSSIIFVTGKLEGVALTPTASTLHTGLQSRMKNWVIIILVLILLLSLALFEKNRQDIVNSQSSFRDTINVLTEEIQKLRFSESQSDPFISWGYTIESRGHFCDLTLDRAYFSNYYGKGLSMVFLVYEYDKAVEADKRTRITISEKREIPLSKGSDYPIRIKVKSDPLIEVFDEIAICLYFVPDSLDMTNFITPGDLETNGGVYIDHKFTRAWIDFNNNEDIAGWISRLPAKRQKEILRYLKVKGVEI